MEPRDAAIYIPTRGTVYYKTIDAIFGQVLKSIGEYSQPLPVNFVQGNADVASVRNQIVRDFLETDKQVLIMVDDDVVVPDNFLMLLHSLDDYPIVGAPCMIVRPGTIHMPNVLWRNKDGNYEVRKEVYSSTGLIECDAVGTGCIAIQRKVLQKIKRPFEVVHDKQGVLEMGEDINFCRRAQGQGFKVAADFNVFCEHRQHLLGKALSQAYIEVINSITDAKEPDETQHG